MKPIILTGFMGSGKSTVARELASIEGLGYLDADHFFTRNSGLTPTFYIRRFGIASFRRLENQFLRNILRNPPQILSTGGGVVLDPGNRHLLLRQGVVVWIRAPLTHILVRLHQRTLPPMLPAPITLKHLEDLYEVRRPCYQKCHFDVFNAFQTPKEVAKGLIQKYKRFNDNHAS